MHRFSGDLHFDPYGVNHTYTLSPHGWPALATGHRTVDSRSSLHGDEQDMGRYPAYWKRHLLLTFRNGEGGCALSAERVGVGTKFEAALPGSANIDLTSASSSPHRSEKTNQVWLMEETCSSCIHNPNEVKLHYTTICSHRFHKML